MANEAENFVQPLIVDHLREIEPGDSVDDAAGCQWSAAAST